MSRKILESAWGLLLLAIVGLAFAGALWCCASKGVGTEGPVSVSPETAEGRAGKPERSVVIHVTGMLKSKSGAT